MAKNSLLKISLGIASILTLTAMSAYSDLISGVPKVTQTQSHWCWAAASECITKFWDPSCTKTQAQIASVITTQNEAPDPTLIEKCLEENGKKVGLQVDTLLRPLTWTEIKRECDAKRPFFMLIRWNSGNYHSNVCAGYVTDSTRIRFMDPSFGSWVDRSYAQCLVVENRGKWERTFLTHLPTTIVPQQHYSEETNTNKLKIITTSSRNSHQTITMLFTESIIGHVKIFNPSGVCVYASNIENVSSQLTWRPAIDLSAGLYIATAEMNGRTTPQIILSAPFYMVK